MTDWASIQSDYEQGLSLRILADKYDISKSMIHKKSTQEGWTVSTKIGGQEWTPPNHTNKEPSTDIAALANTMVGHLAEMAVKPLLDLREHKLFADALSQYGKILLVDAANGKNPLQGSSDQGVLVPHDLLQYIAPEELANIEKYIENAEGRKALAESDIQQMERKRG